jgi:hypothetical protein
MKTKPIILIFLFLTINCLAQTPQPKSVTIDPNGTNIQDVKGNLKVSGITESNSVKVNGLATGNPYEARTVYANNEGFLVTGYKVGYFSIPPVAFKLNYYIQSDGQPSGLGVDLMIYDGGNVSSFYPSSNKELVAPLYFPHKSKLASLKIAFYSYLNTPNSLIGEIIEASLSEALSQSTIFNFTTPTSYNLSWVTVEFPINLLEIDNQNKVYTLKLKNSSNNWSFVNIRGVSIEYRDF